MKNFIGYILRLKLLSRHSKGASLTRIAVLSFLGFVVALLLIQNPLDDARQPEKSTIELLREDAERGDVIAQFKLAEAFENRNRDERDIMSAVHWYQEAGQAGNADAHYALGEMYETGRVVEPNLTTAITWYQKAADQGLAGAQNKLGNLLSIGVAGAPDYEQSMVWYRKAADQGHAAALANIARLYQGGLGVEHDKNEALKWFMAAAEKGSPEAHNYLGAAYKEGDGVLRDYAKALEHFRVAANSGLSYGQSNLGLMYLEGLGVEKDLVEAGRWIYLAEQNGSKHAKDLMEVARHDCSSNVKPDGGITYKPEACFFAAGSGDLPALHAVGVAYLSGAGGVQQDKIKAFEWLTKAARSGSAPAQVHLAIMYDEGDGIPHDPVESLAWFLVAKKNESHLNELQAKVTNGAIRVLSREMEKEQLRASREKAKFYSLNATIK